MSPIRNAKKKPALLDRLKAGDSEALEALIDQYTPYVSAVIHYQLGSFSQPADVEELCADVFVKLWQNSSRIQGKETLKSWLCAVARNAARSFLRRKKEEPPVSLEDVLLVGGDRTLELASQRERQRILKGALERLGDCDREVFVRRYFCNQPVREIADEMKLHPEAVKSKLRRGRAKLKDALLEGGYTCEAIDL